MNTKLTETMLRTYRAELADRIADPERLRRIYGSRFLDRSLRERLHAVCKTARTALGGESSFITLIGADELIFVTVAGDIADEAPTASDQSYCQHVLMTGGQPFAVDDGDTNQLVCNLQAVTEARVLSYLGVPLIDAEGYVVGSLCVAGGQTRSWRPNDAFLLSSLAATATEMAYAPQ